ncbi:hypothetical protein BCR36DRAFT_585485 [Piromyces finnis]|uniref:SH3 domain-containing protein n=1 Tax=Piromyces finnis TaxID=1754191 RepID=A0A1Y1V489_9FUNG|nr:hypothetical protein BCR36DRAFT_585485 [Piromyces finnis]|eukprot:ORX46020.1 hypothetical protein BCR36DRAFT_585485 [Piromyces finnis]
MANHKLFIKLVILYLCITQIVHGNGIINKNQKKKHHKHVLSKKDPIKLLNPEFSFEYRKKFIEKEHESFNLKSKINIHTNDDISKENTKESNTKKESKNSIIVEKAKNSNNNTNEANNNNENSKSENSYYMYGGGIVSIALVGVGFFNVYQRKRNSIFNLTKEELEAINKNEKLNNSYTSLTEEEKQFLHKINKRKHNKNNTRNFYELTEEEILEIRKNNGWAASDDEECQLRHRKLDKRLSSNVRINSTSVIAPRRISLNIKPSKNNLLCDSSSRESNNDIKKFRKNNEISTNTRNQNKKPSNLSIMNLNKKRLSINTKNIAMPPIKMICTIVKNYIPVRSDELKLHLGDKVEIINVYKDGWATGKVISDEENKNKTGYFPLAHASEPEIFDENINEFMIPTPLTPPITRINSNISNTNSSFVNSTSFSNFIINSNVKSNKTKNRQVSMIALSSSSTIHTQEPVSSSSTDSPSIININNNINIFQNNSGVSNSLNNISINININANDKQSSNNIGYCSNKENKNTQIINNNSLLVSSFTTSLSQSSSIDRTSLFDPQNMKNIINGMLEEEKFNNKLTSEKDLQEVFDFLRGNVYNSSVPMEERDYYKKCLERLRMSKLLDMELNKTN